MTHGTDRAQPWGGGRCLTRPACVSPAYTVPFPEGLPTFILVTRADGRPEDTEGPGDDPPSRQVVGALAPDSRPLSLAVGMEVTELAGGGCRDQHRRPPWELVGMQSLGPCRTHGSESALWQPPLYPAPPRRLLHLETGGAGPRGPAHGLVRRTPVLTRDSLCFSNSQGHVAPAVDLVSVRGRAGAAHWCAGSLASCTGVPMSGLGAHGEERGSWDECTMS